MWCANSYLIGKIQAAQCGSFQHNLGWGLCYRVAIPAPVLIIFLGDVEIFASESCLEWEGSRQDKAENWRSNPTWNCATNLSKCCLILLRLEVQGKLPWWRVVACFDRHNSLLTMNSSSELKKIRMAKIKNKLWAKHTTWKVFWSLKWVSEVLFPTKLPVGPPQWQSTKKSIPRHIRFTPCWLDVDVMWNLVLWS